VWTGRWTDGGRGRRADAQIDSGQRGARGGDRWELKLAMGGLDPPMSEAGMERRPEPLPARGDEDPPLTLSVAKVLRPEPPKA
jgi:hypothetical protein